MEMDSLYHRPPTAPFMRSGGRVRAGPLPWQLVPSMFEFSHVSTAHTRKSQNARRTHPRAAGASRARTHRDCAA